MSLDLRKPSALRARTVLLSSMASDSHTWNLVYLQLVLEELGCRVVNLGSCVPDRLLLAECRDLEPDVVVLSSVNGHGYQDGVRVIGKLRAALPDVAVVIGGKLGTAGPDPERAAMLRAAGAAGVFEQGGSEIAAFTDFVQRLPGSHAGTGRSTAQLPGSAV
jgi:methylaspartate mutase sigma subunit